MSEITLRRGIKLIISLVYFGLTSGMRLAGLTQRRLTILYYHGVPAELRRNFARQMDALERAVDYFRTAYRIPVSNLLPYPGLLIPFSYYFFRHPDRPMGEQKDYLQDFPSLLTAAWGFTVETATQGIRLVLLLG